MAHEIRVKLSKCNYIQATKNLLKKSKLRTLARALVHVADIMYIVSAKFA